LDPHARLFEISRAVELCKVVAPFRPMFVEEPLRPENRDAMAKLRELVDVPLATGEMLYTRYEFRELLELQAVNIIQPDICVAGGLWEQKKIAALADAHYVTVAPHNPCGPLATAVNVHFAASTHNFLILEYHADDEGPRREIVNEPIKLVNGYLEIPETPGLGVDLNIEALEKYPFKPWHRAFTFREDGALAYQ
jgi:galactonate dehydratase